MNNKLQTQEKELKRWGGIAGISGGILSLLALVVAEGLIPPSPSEILAVIERFESIRILRVAENLTYLYGLIAGILVCVTLFWILRKTRLASSLFGCVMGVVGLTSMAVFATPHVAHNAISILYNQGSLTAEAKETLGLMWQATWGISEAPLIVGFLVGMVGFVFLSIAMLSSTEFGKIISWICLVISIAGTIAAIFQMVDPASPAGAICFFGFIIINFVVGSQLLRLGKER